MKTAEYRRYQIERKRLIKRGEKLFGIISKVLEPDFPNEVKPGPRFISEYQRWYSEAHEYLIQVFPSRADEFENLYQGDPKRRVVTEYNFAVRDWLIGKNVFRRWSQKEIDRDQAETAIHLFQLQCEILKTSILAFDKGMFKVNKADRHTEKNTAVKIA